MLKSLRDSVISRLGDTDRQSLRQIVAAIKQARGGSPAPASGGRITARELLAEWSKDLPADVNAALEAILTRDESGPRVGELAPDFSLRRLGATERVRLSDFKGQRPIALAFGSYT